MGRVGGTCIASEGPRNLLTVAAIAVGSAILQ